MKLFQGDNAVKGGGVVIVVHLDIALILTDYFSYALYAKPMFLFIRFGGDKFSVPGDTPVRERVFPAGVDHCYDSERCFFHFLNGQFYKGFRDIFAGFHGIIQQITEQGSDIMISHKVHGSAPDIGKEGDMEGGTLLLIPAEDRV